MNVRDLNSGRVLGTICAPEHRPLDPFPSPRSGPLADSLPIGSALRCGEQGSTFRLPTAVDLHGLCAVDLKGRTARYRHLSQRPKRSPLPSWFSRTSCQVHLGRCQRATGLPTLGRSRQRTHAQGACPLRRRGSRIGTGKHGLRSGFHHDRSLAESLPLGRFPKHQSWDQDACPARSETLSRPASTSPEPAMPMLTGSTTCSSKREPST